MKIKVVVKVKDWKLKWPSEDYIDNFKKFKIKCEIADEDFGICNDTYKLKLKGDGEKIEDYLSYLQRKGFKIIRKDKERYNL